MQISKLLISDHAAGSPEVICRYKVVQWTCTRVHNTVYQVLVVCCDGWCEAMLDGMTQLACSRLHCIIDHSSLTAWRSHWSIQLVLPADWSSGSLRGGLSGSSPHQATTLGMNWSLLFNTFWEALSCSVTSLRVVLSPALTVVCTDFPDFWRLR